MRIRGSYRQTFTTGAVTGIAAGTATAGHILALRNPLVPGTAPGIAVVLRALEVEFLLTTAFGSAQEVGFDAFVARGYTAPHTGATALTLGKSGRRRGGDPDSVLAGRVADTGALTAGTHTLDANAIARGSCYCSAVGAQLTARRYDFTERERDGKPSGIWMLGTEGLVLRNTIAMGASGVGKWHFTAEWLEVEGC